MKYLYWLLLLVPTAVIAHLLSAPPTLTIRTPNEQLSVVKATEHLGRGWSKQRSFLTLAGSAVAVGGMSEILVHHLEGFCHSAGMRPAFVGFMIVPLVSNVAENSVAVRAAVKNNVDLMLAVAIESALPADAPAPRRCVEAFFYS